VHNNSDVIPLVSPKTARVLWIITLAFAGLLLALNLWGWALRGEDWTTLLGSVGFLVLIGSYPFIRSRVRLYVVLQIIALGLIITDMILRVRR